MLNSDKPLVLIVDDNITNLDILVEAFHKDYRLGIAKSGEKALEYARNNHPQLILLDIMMPEMNGYEVCRRLKASDDTCDISVIFITAVHETASKTKGFDMGAVDYITKPFNVTEAKARVRTHLALIRMQAELNDRNLILEQKVQAKTKRIRETLESTIVAMSRMGEMRDPYTAGHQNRVSQLACMLADRLSFSKDDIDTIRIAALLHDIGKFRIPVDILNRPGDILDIEYSMLKLHPEIGFNLLSDIPFAGPVAQIVYQHHERLDGSGYPQGLFGKDILPAAKVLAVADVVEAMVSHRPYRPALGNRTALKTITESRGIHFDAKAVVACCALIEQKIFTFT
jgi:putative two-component system response regulator